MRKAVSTRPRSPFEALQQVEGLRRAWPRRDGSIVLERVDPQTGLLRAGHVGQAGHVQLVPYAKDPALPALGADHPGRLVVHRLGRRAVLLEDSTVRKLVRPGRAERLTPNGMERALHHSGLGTATVLAQNADQASSKGFLARAWPNWETPGCPAGNDSRRAGR